jgi:hypothetical protein
VSRASGRPAAIITVIQQNLLRQGHFAHFEPAKQAQLVTSASLVEVHPRPTSAIGQMKRRPVHPTNSSVFLFKLQEMEADSTCFLHVEIQIFSNEKPLWGPPIPDVAVPLNHLLSRTHRPQCDLSKVGRLWDSRRHAHRSGGQANRHRSFVMHSGPRRDNNTHVGIVDSCPYQGFWDDSTDLRVAR